MAQDAKVEYWKYVDDLTFVENKAHDDQGNLQDDLDDFVDWAKLVAWSLTQKKCQALEVNFTKTAPHHADIRIGSDNLPYVDKAMILGVWLQNDLKWQSQIDNAQKSK